MTPHRQVCGPFQKTALGRTALFMSTILNDPKQRCKVLSRLADKMPMCGRLYWIVKALDLTNQGEAEIDVDLISRYLKVKPSTVERYIRQCLANNYFHNVTRIGKGEYAIVYRSYKAIAASLNIWDVGIAVWMNRKDFRDYKRHITRCEMSERQNQSIFRAKKENKQYVAKHEKQFKLLPWMEQEVKKASSEIRTRWRGPQAILRPVKKKMQVDAIAPSKPILKQNKPTVGQFEGSPRKARQTKVILHRGSRFVITTMQHIPFGASQLGLANESKRAVSTIRRRLLGVHRKQVLQVMPVSPDEALFLRSEGKCDDKFIINNGTVFKPLPNVYRFSDSHHYSSAHRQNLRLAGYSRHLQLAKTAP